MICSLEYNCCASVWSYLSLLGQISGELGLDDVSDLTSCDSGQLSADFWSLQTKSAH